MNRNEIFKLIRNHTYEVAPYLNKESIKLTDNLKDLGVDSMGRAEIVMMVMEELTLNISKIDLAKANNIEELVDLFSKNINHIL